MCRWRRCAFSAHWLLSGKCLIMPGWQLLPLKHNSTHQRVVEAQTSGTSRLVAKALFCEIRVFPVGKRTSTRHSRRAVWRAFCPRRGVSRGRNPAMLEKIRPAARFGNCQGNGRAARNGATAARRPRSHGGSHHVQFDALRERQEDRCVAVPCIGLCTACRSRSKGKADGVVPGALGAGTGQAACVTDGRPASAIASSPSS